VPIRDCTVIAVEGTHASGKTTLVHALVSYYRERGIHATCVDEPARSSPFMEDIVLRGQGTFDVIAEPRHVRCPAHHPAPGGPPPQRPGRRPRRRSTSWPTRGRCSPRRTRLSSTRCSRYAEQRRACTTPSSTPPTPFDPHQPGDALRAKVAGQQAGIDVVLRETAAQAGITLIDIPRGLATPDRVRWVSEYLAESGVLPH